MFTSIIESEQKLRNAMRFSLYILAFLDHAFHVNYALILHVYNNFTFFKFQ